jgi:hypothetical protein
MTWSCPTGAMAPTSSRPLRKPSPRVGTPTIASPATPGTSTSSSTWIVRRRREDRLTKNGFQSRSTGHPARGDAHRSRRPWFEATRTAGRRHPADPAAPDQPGRPRFRPKKLHGDNGYHYPPHRRALRRRGIMLRTARRSVESGERLRRHRRVVERSIGWLLASRQLAVRYDRQATPVIGLLHLARTLICVRCLGRAEAAT